MYESNYRLLCLGVGCAVSLCSPGWPQICIHWVLSSGLFIYHVYTTCPFNTVLLICNTTIDFKTRTFKGVQTWEDLSLLLGPFVASPQGLNHTVWHHVGFSILALQICAALQMLNSWSCWSFALWFWVSYLIFVTLCFLSYNWGLMLLLLLSLVRPHGKMQISVH